jgi:hypothetical protein
MRTGTFSFVIFTAFAAWTPSLWAGGYIQVDGKKVYLEDSKRSESQPNIEAKSSPSILNSLSDSFKGAVDSGKSQLERLKGIQESEKQRMKEIESIEKDL